MKKIIPYLLAVAGGLIYWLAHDYHSLWPLAFVAFIPFFHLIYGHNFKYGKIFLLGSIMGWVSSAGILSWYWSTLPLDWAGIDSRVIGPLLVAYVWLTSSAMGVFGGFFAIITKWLKQRNWFDLLTIPAIGVIIGFVRSWAVTVFWHGDGGLIGPHWSLGSIGYALASSPATLPLAAIGGLHLLSFVVFLFNLLIYFTIASAWKKADWKKHLWLLLALITFILLFSGLYYGQPEKKLESVSVAVLNTYRPSFSTISGKESFDNIAKILELLRQIRVDKRTPDIVVLPEDSRVLASLKILSVQPVIDDLVGEREVLIIDSARVVDPVNNIPILKFTFLNTKTGKLTESDKLLVTPHGEYLPYLTKTLLKLIGQEKWTHTFEGLRKLTGGKRLNVAEFKDIKLGAVACLEVMSPSISRELVELDTAFLINTASHSLFNGSPRLYGQVFNMSRVRAVENNRYYVHSGNYVPSYIIDNKGRVLKESAWSQDSITYQDVEVVTASSIYNKFGRRLMVLGLTLIICLAVLQKSQPDYFNKIFKK